MSPGSATTAACHYRVLAGKRDLLGLHAARPDRYPFILESVAHGTRHGRYDVLFAFPGAALRLDAARVLHPPQGHAHQNDDFLGGLDAWWSVERAEHATDVPFPFRGGWFLFFAYEFAGQVEPTLRLPRAQDALPVALAVRCPAAILVDHERGESVLVAEDPVLLDALADDLARCTSSENEVTVHVALGEEEPQHFLDGVARVLDYIIAGDVFQVNLSRAWCGPAHGVSAAALYRRLRRANPGPFAGLGLLGQAAVISSSPERLVKVNGRHVETRPIAGTLARRADHRERVAPELLGNPKERAEHVMLIDLERNDLGRVCRPGSVTVDELMALESYAHVHHIVSNVAGELRAEVTPGAVIRAVFPGGTITGCPKVRCMEIIAELEKTPRGAYTGSMGYLNRDGDMDLNILIRTMTLTATTLSLRAGAGIVADSRPERELAETRAKARGLLLALGAVR